METGKPAAKKALEETTGGDPERMPRVAGDPERMLQVADMPPEEFRRHGHRLIDWIADYLADPGRLPVLAQVKPGELRARLPADAPDTGEDFDQVLADWERLVLPGVTHWNHPGFFAYFAITGSAPGILGELLSGALNVNAMLWRTGPAATELEEVVMGWLRNMIGLPEEFFGVVMDTASVASLCAIAAAREAQGPQFRERGLAGGPRLALYASEQAHSSIEKGAIALGLGRENVRRIPVDADFRMDVAALERAARADRAAGRLPFCVVATAGTTSTTSVDPIEAIARVCAAEKMWLHVDAAYAGAAAILPEMRPAFAGWERADSVVLNPHKWMFTPFDFSALYCRRPNTLRDAFSLVPEYLRAPSDRSEGSGPSSDRSESSRPPSDTAAAGEAVNFMDYGVQLGRRFRALKFWFVLRYFGREGMRSRLREHIRLAREFAAWVDGDPDFERLAPAPFSVVCFRARPGAGAARSGPGAPAAAPPDNARLNDFNAALLDSVNGTGKVFLSHTKLGDRFTLRLAVGNLRTTGQHVRAAWELLRAHAADLAPKFF